MSSIEASIKSAFFAPVLEVHRLKLKSNEKPDLTAAKRF
jgi:hypothetical protein